MVMAGLDTTGSSTREQIKPGRVPAVETAVVRPPGGQTAVVRPPGGGGGILLPPPPLLPPLELSPFLPPVDRFLATEGK